MFCLVAGTRSQVTSIGCNGRKIVGSSTTFAMCEGIKSVKKEPFAAPQPIEGLPWRGPHVVPGT